MWLIVLYSPALVLLPIALIVGIFVVLFSAGLLILLGSLYLLVMVFRGLIEFRIRRRRHLPRRRLVAASSAPRSIRTGASATPALGRPLYGYVGDQQPGDTNGQGLNQFGAKWYLLAPSGRKIDDD